MTNQYPNRRVSDERGTAVVELSIAILVVSMLLFGIVNFGIILSFKQGMTQAAAEGARAGAVVSYADAPNAAELAAQKSADAFGKICDVADANGDGLACTFVVATCVGNAAAQCITVDMDYDYENHPLIPPLPLIAALLPDTLESTFVAEVDP